MGPRIIPEPPKETRKKLEVPPATEMFGERVTREFCERSVWQNPEGPKMAVAGHMVDLETGEPKILMTDISTKDLQTKAEEYHLFDARELNDWKRILREGEYVGQDFMDRKKGIAIHVLETIPKKNILRAVDQEGKEHKIKYKKFIEGYYQADVDDFIPFQGSYMQEKETCKELYIQKLDYKKNHMVAVESQMLIDNKTGEHIVIIDPRTSKTITFEEMRRSYQTPLPSVAEQVGDVGGEEGEYDRMRPSEPESFDIPAEVYEAEFDIIDEKKIDDQQKAA
jgi:hypothetical protein